MENGFDLFWGLEEQEKKSVLSVGWIEIECFVLNFHKRKTSPLSSISMKVKRVFWARFLAYVADLAEPEIESSELESLESKLVWNVS